MIVSEIAIKKLWHDARPENYISQVPVDLREAIERSAQMLDYEEDFDGYDSPVIAESTWRLTVDFLLQQWVTFHESHGFWLPIPDIGYCGGSIDFYWKDRMCEGYLQTLLINIDGNKVTYYGDCRKDFKSSLRDNYAVIKKEAEDELTVDSNFTDVWLWLVTPHPPSAS